MRARSSSSCKALVIESRSCRAACTAWGRKSLPRYSVMNSLSLARRVPPVKAWNIHASTDCKSMIHVYSEHIVKAHKSLAEKTADGINILGSFCLQLPNRTHWQLQGNKEDHLDITAKEIPKESWPSILQPWAHCLCFGHPFSQQSSQPQSSPTASQLQQPAHWVPCFFL